MATAVHIVGTGARTPLGLHVEPSAVALQAGISGVRGHPFYVDHLGDPMPCALDAVLDPSLTGPLRLLALAQSPLRDACRPLEGLSGQHPRLPIYLGLPEPRPGFSERDAQVVQSELAQIRDLPAEITEVRIAVQGHASGLSALAAAVQHIGEGAIEACIVGGVDSYCHPDTMEWLDANRQLLGAAARSAFAPGEGAGFCLLMAAPTASRLGLRAAAGVLSASIARETKRIKTADVCLGNGLTAAVANAVRILNPPTQTVTDIFCDINGERYRGEEWGFICLRLPQYFDDPTAYVSPADRWGDMGAASGPLFAALACFAATRGYGNGSRSLLWASSEGGLRAAALLAVNSSVGALAESRNG